jgi:tannase
MFFSKVVLITSPIVLSVYAATLADVCTTSYVQSSLPTDQWYTGTTINNIIFDRTTITANAVYNASANDSNAYPNGIFDYCNISLAYSHAGRNDNVNVVYWLPAPDNFQNRYLSTGGGGYAINSGLTSLPGGLLYGASAGATDGGFGGFNIQFDANFPLVNGTANWESLYMFGYQAIHELGLIGKELTRNFFQMANNTKLYSYYQGCSEGGREGWSQVQRYSDSFDGAIIGAPAFRFSFQQTQHLYSNVVEQTVGYYPSPCELEKILNETIAFCDPLDGKTDGVVSRTDLCKMQFNVSSTIGKAYSCAASSGSTGPTSQKAKRQIGGQQSSPLPAQNGTVRAEAALVAQTIIDGLKDSRGRQVYFSYQPSATWDDAQTQYNSTTDKWELSINTMGSEWIARFLWLQNTSDFTTLEGVTYDTLKQWMIQGWHMYQDSLETTWPDLTPYYTAGGKILHYHGESDFSIPAASSVRFHESVRQIMYPQLSFNDSTAELNSWYKLFLVPGAGHCSPSTTQPNGPFPNTNLAVMIEWVENGIEPQMLNATVLQGDNEGEKQQLCQWPLRPLWTKNETSMDCVYDQASIDTWLYDLNAVPMPVY